MIGVTTEQGVKIGDLEVKHMVGYDMMVNRGQCEVSTVSLLELIKEV